MSIIQFFCKRCKGTGTVPGSQPDPLDPDSYDPIMVTCGLCQGEASYNVGIITGDLIDTINDMEDKINDIKDKCDDIFEKVNE